MNQMVGIVFALLVFILITAFVVGFLELAVPLIIKADFDRTCDIFLERAYEKSGLTNSDVIELTTAIQALSPKITVSSINVSQAGSIPQKGTVVFEIDAVYQNSNFVSLLVRQVKTYNLRYDKYFANKVIIN